MIEQNIIEQNRATILEVLRDPVMENLHVRDDWFRVDVLKDSTDKPALKTCPACALGMASLAIGFDQFIWIEAGTVDADGSGYVHQHSYWTYDDRDAIQYLCDQAKLCESIADEVIHMNDNEAMPLTEIADYIENAWRVQDTEY